LKWIDIQMTKLKDEKAGITELYALEDDFNQTVERLNELTMSVSFNAGITDQILEKLGNIQKEIDALENGFRMVYANFATKDMLMEEVETIEEALIALEDLTYDLSAENEELIEQNVWALNQRLKWVDITINRAKKEHNELSEYVRELEVRLENEISDNIANLNKRLKWMDISIAKLKETKVDSEEYNETIETLETGKVDKADYNEGLNRIDQRLDALNDSVDILREDMQLQFEEQTTTFNKALDENKGLIKENRQASEKNEESIEALKDRVTELEAKVFPEEKKGNPGMMVLVGLGLVAGIGMIVSGSK